TKGVVDAGATITPAEPYSFCVWQVYEANLAWRQGKLDRVAQILAVLDGLLDKITVPRVMSYYFTNRGDLELWRGNVAAARDASRQALDPKHTAGDSRSPCWACTGFVGLLLAEGKLREALRTSAGLVQALRKLELRDHLPQVLVAHAQALAAAGCTGQ